MDPRLQNVDAEQAVLGCCLLVPSCLVESAQMLGAEGLPFSDPYIGNVWRTALEQYRAGVPMDLVPMVQRMKGERQPPDQSYESVMIEAVQSVGSTGALPSYLQAVLSCYQRRTVIETARMMAERLNNEWAIDPADIVPEFLEKMRAVASKPSTWNRTLHTVLQERGQVYVDGVRGILTGFGPLDAKLRGMTPGDMIVVAARPSVGKSAFGLSVCRNVASDGVKVAFASVEMSEDESMIRAISAYTERSGFTARTGSRDERQEIVDAAFPDQSIRNIMINDKVTTIDQVIAWGEHVASKGAKLYCVDYLQLIGGRVRKGSNRQELIEEISRALKLLARRTKMVVMAMAQLNREYEKRGDNRPMLSDIKSSGAIEQDADIVITLHIANDEQVYNNSSQSITTVTIAKNRNGEAGASACVKMTFLKTLGKFIAA